MSEVIYFYNEAESQTTAEVASIYPNPVDDELFVRIASAEGGTVTIIDLLGNEVGRASFGPGDGQQTRQVRVSVAELPAGVYFVRLELGARTQILRFTKQ